MHKKGVFLIIFCAIGLLSAQAHLGDTPRQAAEKFGPPTGEMRMGGKEILIYETQWGRVTEAYNPEGFCIESDVDRFPELAALKTEPAETEPAAPTPQATASAAQAPPPTTSAAVPQGSSSSRWPLIGIALALSALAGTVTVILLNRRAAHVSGAGSADAGNLSAFIEKQASENA